MSPAGFSVLELADRVSMLADQVQGAIAEEGRRANLESRRARLRGATQHLNLDLLRVQELKVLGVEWAEVDALERFSTKRKSFTEAWLRSDEALTFIDGVEAIHAEVSASIAEAWQDRLDRAAPSFPDHATVRVLRERGGDDDTLGAVDALALLSADFADLKRKVRPDLGDAQELVRLEGEVAEAWDVVRGGTELSPERLELLKQVNSMAGVPLANLSDEDLLWLRQSGSAHSLVLRRRA